MEQSTFQIFEGNKILLANFKIKEIAETSLKE
jgi:hypothetical protein